MTKSEWSLFMVNISNFSSVMVETSYIRWDDDDIRSVLDQQFDFYSANSQMQQSTGRHFAWLGHSILILNQLLLINIVCLTAKQYISNLQSLFWPDDGSNSRSTALDTNTISIPPPMRYSFHFIIKDDKMVSDEPVVRWLKLRTWKNVFISNILNYAWCFMLWNYKYKH